MRESTNHRIGIIEGILHGIERDTLDPEEIERGIENVNEKAERWRWAEFCTSAAAIDAFTTSLRGELDIE